ncbi:MAG: glycosyltransferase family 39 protein [Vicinamibacteria bacterium]|nr:glycosyltransferase family 39 protein [Vicinamibacteria bacterium]
MKNRLLLGLILALSAAAFLIGLSDAPIERAEIYFLDAARAMVERSDWLVPYYRGEPFYDKPPLTYWLLATSFKFLGPSLFAGRLVAALLALLTLLATYLGTRRLIARAEDGGTTEASDTAAFFATAILATSYAFVSFARLTMSDMLLTLLTFLAGVLYLRGESESRQTWLIPCGFILGLGFLAKGPIAWIYFGALLAAFVLVERRLPRIFTPKGLLGTLLAVGTGLSWFFFIYQREGIEPLKWFFLRENLQRFAAPTYDTAQPFWYYFLIYAVEGLPWSILALPATLFAFRAGSPRILRVLLIWPLLMLVPLSLSRGKIDYYLLPLLPPLSLLIGAYLATSAPSARVLRALAGVVAVLLVGAIFFPMLPAPFAPSASVVTAMRAFFALAALACLSAAFRPTVRAVVSVCALSVLGTALFLFGAIVPAYRAAQPTEELLDHIARERVYTPDLQIAVCDDTLRLQRDILFTLRIPVMEHCELWQVASSSRKFLIIVTLLQERSLRTADNVRHIASLKHLPADVTRLSTLLEGAHVSKVGLLANFQTTDPVARWKRNREFKRWLDTPEGQKAEAERLEKERLLAEERRRAGLR